MLLCLFVACICMRCSSSCECADLCSNHLLLRWYVFPLGASGMFMKQRNWPLFSLGALSAIWRLSHSTPLYWSPSRLCLVMPMSDCGTGHFIEFDDPLWLKWRSSSLRAKEILYRQQGNHKEITVPADLIASLIYINQGGKELYRLKKYISEAVLVMMSSPPTGI